MAAARGLPIPAPDDIPADVQSNVFPSTGHTTKEADKKANVLAIPTASRSPSFHSDTSPTDSPVETNFVVPSSPTSANPAASGFRGRAKTLASLTTSSKNPQAELTPRAMQLPEDPYVSGQRLEAYLYKDAAECPICFLNYPPYLNRTRCCDQAICSECFVQIKRPDPHPPEHADAPAPPTPSAENVEPVDLESLVSEPAACPFCVQPEFGITYDPPPFRRGLTYVNQASTHPLAGKASAMSSSSSLASAKSGGQASSMDATRRRTQSLSATAPTVITTDRIRPGWHQKLAGARAHAARRSAAATALHTAAYLMGNRGHEPDGRGFGAFGRRALLRRGSGDPGSSQLNMLAMMSERYGRAEVGENGAPRTRRVRAEDLDEMMMMEAIRLSIASEEERRKKEEEKARKDAKKDAKKQDKENKKAEKAAKKGRAYTGSAPPSTTDLVSPQGRSMWGDGASTTAGKGKEIQPSETSMEGSSSDFTFSSPAYSYTSNAVPDNAQQHLAQARANIQPEVYGTSSYRPSHLRHLSSASSTDDESAAGSLRAGFHGSTSSFDASPAASGMNVPTAGISQVDYTSGTPPGGGAGLEPMFNFRSLAAMVGDDEKHGNARHNESIEEGNGGGSSSMPAAVDQGPRAADLSRNDSTKTANESFHDVSEIAYPAAPEVNITAPSRSNSNTVSAPYEKQAHVSESETMVGNNSV